MSLNSRITKLEPSEIQQFNETGFLVIKDALSKPTAQAYLDDIQKCWDNGDFEPNKVEFLTAQGPLQLQKPHIYESDMHRDATRTQLPSFKKLFQSELKSLIARINTQFPDMDLVDGGGNVASALTVKLQINKGGSFPWHYDNPAPPNKRKLTLAMYLTPEYEEANGGQLVVMPFLREQVVIPPAFNTMVLFRSDLVNHRVLKAREGSTRYCFTIWFDSASVNPDDEVNLRAKHLTADFIPKLINSPVQRALSRAVYDAEYIEALLECFGSQTKEALLSIKMHEAHVKPLLSNPAVKAFVDVLIALKPTPSV